VLLATGCKNKPPVTPVRPAGLDTVKVDVAATYRSWTTDPNGDQIRYVFDWGEVTDAAIDTTGYFASGDTASGSHAWAAIGAYALRVKAQDENGNWSVDWSDTHMVYVTTEGGANTPPDAPATPQGPDSGWVNQWMAFSTSTQDPNGDSVQIKFYFDDNMASNWSTYVAGGTTVSDSIQYQYRGTKSVHAVARDVHGDTSDWSPAAALTIYAQNTPPGKPTITGPARGIKDGPMYLFYGRARDPQGDNVEYRFFWGDGTASNWTPANEHGIPVPDSTSYSVNGTYNIRCIARDIDGAVSDTSDPFVFQVVSEKTILWGLPYGEVVSSPALATVYDGTNPRPGVIVGLGEGNVVAVDAWQGTELYKTTESTDPYHSSAAISSDGMTAYIGNSNGSVYAFDAHGARSWVRKPYPDTLSGEDMGATPAIDGASIYVAGEAGYVIKLTDNGTSPAIVWTRLLTSEAYASPAITAAGIVVADDSGYVYILSASDGAILHSIRLDGGITSSPAIGTDGTIYIGTDQGTMYALTPTCTETWHYTIEPFAQIVGSPVIAADGGVVYGADNGYLYKLDRATGQPVTGFPVLLTQGDLISTPAICADGVIYVVSDDDKLYAVKDNGSLHWPNPVELILTANSRRTPRPRSFATDDLTPSVVIDEYGIIYIASNLDGIFAVAGRAAGTLADTPWPMFHRDIRHSGKSSAW
jgi:outer membrane protein assembly factor BamB